MQITVYNKQRDLSLETKALKLMIPFLLKELGATTDEVIIHFVSTRAICKLHDQFFSDPSPTDCISFPIDPPGTTSSQHHILGEIFVCPSIAIDYAKRTKKDPYEETRLYVIHGLLHLLGYDDLASNSRKEMRRMEKKCQTLCKFFSLTKKKIERKQEAKV